MKSVHRDAAAKPARQYKNAPEIRDNPDSRKDEEQDFKGNDITHNRQPNHNKGQVKKKAR